MSWQWSGRLKIAKTGLENVLKPGFRSHHQMERWRCPELVAGSREWQRVDAIKSCLCVHGYGNLSTMVTWWWCHHTLFHCHPHDGPLFNTLPPYGRTIVFYFILSYLNDKMKRFFATNCCMSTVAPHPPMFSNIDYKFLMTIFYFYFSWSFGHFSQTVHCSPCPQKNFVISQSIFPYTSRIHITISHGTAYMAHHRTA